MVEPRPQGQSPVRLPGILVKAILVFATFNTVYFVTQPLNLLNHLTVYNALVPGRTRLPFSEYPDASYSLIVTNIDQMLASHQIATAKAQDEFRVVMIGDSSVWGYLLPPTQTQAECLNELGLTLPSGRKVHVYNLGYPTLSVTKDFLILRHALQYKPDLVIWPMTLASLYPTDQLGFEVVHAHFDEVSALETQYHFRFDPWPPANAPTWIDHTFVGQRRELADWLRYQLYALDWNATQIDHAIPKFVSPHPTSLVEDNNLLSVGVMRLAQAGKLAAGDLSLDVVKAAIDTAQAQQIPVLLVNEPMYRSDTSQLRWNSYYPKWAYDDYRTILQDSAAHEGWHYIDYWNAVPNDQFTDTDFHLTPDASCDYARKLSEPLMALAASQP